MLTKADLHRLRYTIDTMAYSTFDENSGKQRLALNEALDEIDRLIRKADAEFDQDADTTDSI
jgi:hypothetical protein